MVAVDVRSGKAAYPGDVDRCAEAMCEAEVMMTLHRWEKDFLEAGGIGQSGGGSCKPQRLSIRGWETLSHYNINAYTIRVIRNLYDQTSSAVYLNGNIGKWFQITVGVRQRCLVSPTLFNIFLERIMTEALEEQKGTVSIGGRTFTNLRFADDTDELAGSEQELENLVRHLDRSSTAYDMKISANKTKLMTNSIDSMTYRIVYNATSLPTEKSLKL